MPNEHARTQNGETVGGLLRHEAGGRSFGYQVYDIRRNNFVRRILMQLIRGGIDARTRQVELFCIKCVRTLGFCDLCGTVENSSEGLWDGCNSASRSNRHRKHQNVGESADLVMDGVRIGGTEE